MDQTVKNDDSVIILLNDTRYFFCRIKADRQIKVGQNHIQLSDFIGLPYGAIVEASKGTLKQINPTFKENVITEDKKSNKNLIPNTENQKISHQDIEKMKQDMDGESIIDALVQNSSSFETKTEFSKEKYIKKKKQRYVQELKILYPSTKSICQAFISKNTEKICNLREDSLAHILTLSNVTAALSEINENQIKGLEPLEDQNLGRFLVFENCAGLVTGSIAERLGGFGRIVSLFDSTHPSVAALESILHTHISHIPTTDYNPVIETPFDQKISNIVEKGFHSLIISSSFDSTSVLLGLLPFLSKGRPFVVYSRQINLLTNLLQWLVAQNVAVNVQIHESWFREYQVLPLRTHPKMQMSNESGFILSGIKIHPYGRFYEVPKFFQSRNEGPSKKRKLNK